GAGHGRRAPAARARDEGVGGRRALAGTRTRTGHGPRRRRACAPVLARLVRPRHQDLHGHVRPARRRRRTRPLRDLGLRRRVLGGPHEEPRGRRAQGRIRRARGASDGCVHLHQWLCTPPSLDGRPGPNGQGNARRPRLSRTAHTSALPRRRRPRARAALSAPGRRGHVRGEHGARDRARCVLGRRGRAPGRGQFPRDRRRARKALGLSRRDRPLLTGEIWTGSLNDAYRVGGHVGLYDTTLRDGEQTVGVVLDSQEKLEIAKLLDVLGVDRIEAGFPRVSQDDWDAVKLIADAGLAAQVWGFSRAVPADLEALVELNVPASVIESPISDLKLNAIGVDRDTMLGRITKAMRFAAEHGIHAAFFGVDSTRAEPDFYERVYKRALEAGATEVVVVDT